MLQQHPCTVEDGPGQDWIITETRSVLSFFQQVMRYSPTSKHHTRMVFHSLVTKCGLSLRCVFVHEKPHAVHNKQIGKAYTGKEIGKQVFPISYIKVIYYLLRVQNCCLLGLFGAGAGHSLYSVPCTLISHKQLYALQFHGSTLLPLVPKQTLIKIPVLYLTATFRVTCGYCCLLAQ